MKSIYKTAVLILWVSVAFISCKQDSLMLYNQQASGANIYFPQVVTKNDTVFQLITFGYVGAGVKDSIIGVPVQTTGNAVNYDRVIKVYYDAGTTAIEGTHFDYIRKPIIRAGLVTDTILIKIKRTADMVTQQFKLSLKLDSNQYFNINLPGINTATKQLSYLKYNIYMDDMAGVSFLWTTFAGRTTVVGYFGTYSRKKVDLMIQVLGVNPAYFYDPTTSLGVGQLISWARYMKWWLTQQELAGTIYYDENGNKITMGVNAS